MADGEREAFEAVTLSVTDKDRPKEMEAPVRESVSAVRDAELLSAPEGDGPDAEIVEDTVFGDTETSAVRVNPC